jgi:hypothetical protein
MDRICPASLGVRWILSFDDFNDALGVDFHEVGLPEVNDDMVVSRRADVSWFFERVLRPIAESHCKRSEWLPLNETLDFLDLHRPKLTPLPRFKLTQNHQRKIICCQPFGLLESSPAVSTTDRSSK